MPRDARVIRKLDAVVARWQQGVSMDTLTRLHVGVPRATPPLAIVYAISVFWIVSSLAIGHGARGIGRCGRVCASLGRMGGRTWSWRLGLRLRTRPRLRTRSNARDLCVGRRPHDQPARRRNHGRIRGSSVEQGRARIRRWQSVGRVGRERRLGHDRVTRFLTVTESQLDRTAGAGQRYKASCPRP